MVGEDDVIAEGDEHETANVEVGGKGIVGGGGGTPEIEGLAGGHDGTPAFEFEV